MPAVTDATLGHLPRIQLLRQALRWARVVSVQAQTRSVRSAVRRLCSVLMWTSHAVPLQRCDHSPPHPVTLAQGFFVHGSPGGAGGLGPHLSPVRASLSSPLPPASRFPCWSVLSCPGPTRRRYLGRDRREGPHSSSGGWREPASAPTGEEELFLLPLGKQLRETQTALQLKEGWGLHAC